jgi:hypothetical protein
VTVRMPSATEQRIYHLADDEPALEIVRSNGTVEVHGTGLTEVVFVACDSASYGRSPAAKWQRIVEDVRRAVAAGGLRPGDQLPSEDQFATRYGTSRTTIRRAIAEIRKLGLVTVDGATGALVVVPKG